MSGGRWNAARALSTQYPSTCCLGESRILMPGYDGNFEVILPNFALALKTSPSFLIVWQSKVGSILTTLTCFSSASKYK